MKIPAPYLWLIIQTFVISISTSTANALPAETSTSGADRPRIGLALSGGGARGAAHIGVLKVLELNRIPIDFIAGSSMGSIVGGMYASGMSPDELEAMISHIDWADAFTDRIPRKDRSFRRKRDDDLYLVKNKPGVSGLHLKFPPGLLDGQKIDLLLKRNTLHVWTIRDFDDLSIPYRAVVADLETGEPMVLEQGDLALAMRTSMSIPIVFSPKEIDGKLLVDGGLSCNLPIDIVRRMGADVVIAVDISTPMKERDELTSVLAVTDQITSILTRRNTDIQIKSLGDGDIFIRPDLGDISTASFDRAGEAVPIGVAAAEAAAGDLERYSVSEQEYRECRAGRAMKEPDLNVDEIRIINQSRLSDDVIKTRLDVETGKPLNIDELERDLEQIFGLELFESVYYDIFEKADSTILTVTVRERSWGPNYLQFGIAIFEDFEGPNFNISAAYTRTAVNRLNGEWRTALQIGKEPNINTEFYQPVDHALRYFVHPRASIGEKADNLFDSEGHKISELNIFRYGVGLSAGRELGTWGEIRTGIEREAGTISTLVGDPGVPDIDFDTGEMFFQFFADELDDINFPSSGGSLRIRLTAAREYLGSDLDYDQMLADGSLALSVGRNTALLRGYFATTLKGNSPYQNLFRLGGFTHLSGLEQNELRGQHAALVSGTFYRRIADISLVSLYGGFSLEYGNVFQERDHIDLENGRAAGCLFLGLDTLIGPVYVAYGITEGDRQNYYLFLGRSL
jgi:NTE family protein